MTPKVSVIVPVYNTKKYLPRCMESLQKQTLQELQMILVDDGSSDGSGELCDSYARKDRRIEVVHQKNRGLGMARNAGILLAKGEYIGFVDSDDYVLPEMYERMYTAGISGRAEMVLAGMRQVGGSLFAEENSEKQICCFEKEEVFEGAEGIKKLMLGTAGALPGETEDSRYNFSVCKNIYRRELIQRKGIFFESERKAITEDVLFGLDFISNAERAVGIPGAYYCYCRNDASLTRAYRPDTFGQFKKMVPLIEERLSKCLAESEYQIYTDRMLQARARTAIAAEVFNAAEKRLPRKIWAGRIRGICSDESLQQVLRRYPYWKLPYKQALFAFFMRYRRAGCLWCLVRLKEKG